MNISSLQHLRLIQLFFFPPPLKMHSFDFQSVYFTNTLVFVTKMNFSFCPMGEQKQFYRSNSGGSVGLSSSAVKSVGNSVGSSTDSLLGCFSKFVSRSPTAFVCSFLMFCSFTLPYINLSRISGIHCGLYILITAYRLSVLSSIFFSDLCLKFCMLI